MKYEEGVNKIPTAAIATADANYLEDLSKAGEKIEISLELTCEDHGMVPSFNVIAELKGAENPNNVFVIGGHLDSWDVGEGAHDDGAGIIHSIEALRIFKVLGIRPKNTIRCILYMNEENGNNGGKTYAEWAKKSGEKHIVAIESDRGGFVPRGFSFDAKDHVLLKVKQWEKLLEPYNLHIFKKGFSGVDIKPLKNDDISLIGFVPDPQRYFDFHHTEDDVFENVHKRELELGCASIASLLFLIDKYGLGEPAP
jgi:carboxypeptidase Q